MKFGFSEIQLDEIISFIQLYPEVEEAVLFGSRAIDTFKEASDVDIALKGEKVTAGLAAKLKFNIEEDTYLPFFFDFVAYPTITNEELRKHIKDKGIVIYRKSMSKWVETKINYVIEIIGGGTPKTTISEYWFGDIPWLSVVDFNTGRKYVNHTEKSITEVGLNNSSTKILQKGDIIISARGTVGAIAVLKKPMAFNQSCYGLRGISNIADTDFIYYLTNHSINQLQQIAHGGVFDTITKDTFKSIDILLPPLPEQKAIASVLSSLDDKIDLLHRQNKTLEAMADMLFRQWFVEESEEDWEEGKIPDEFDYIMGASPPGSSYNEIGEGVPMYQGNADFNFRFPKRRVYTTDPKRFAQKYDTLISVRAPVGAQNMADEKCCIGRGVSAFRYRKNNKYYTYTYFKLRSLMKEIKEFNHTETVFGSISKSDFENFDVILPPVFKVEKFQVEVRPIDDKIISNSIQIYKLEKIRDTLLPKLMSGEVTVHGE